MAQKKFREAMDLRISYAIDKMESLERDTNINKRMSEFDPHIGKTYVQQEIISSIEMVAELERQYGENLYEAYVYKKDHNTVPPDKVEVTIKSEKEKAKAR